MTFTMVGQYLNVLLATILLLRLAALRLYSHYWPFLLFVFFECFQSLVSIVWGLAKPDFDYRIVWVTLRFGGWCVTFCMVYALLKALLRKLPGILRFSQWLLNGVIVVAICLAMLTVRPEYAAAPSAKYPSVLAKITLAALALERAFAMAEILAILAILAFLLRFPIRLPRNLVAFTGGMCLYLLIKVGLLLARSYLPSLPDSFIQGLSITISLAFSLCLLVWTLVVTRAGETTTSTIGLNWRRIPHEQIVRQLEAMNAALLRSREQT
jgi:hypothetical protein